MNDVTTTKTAIQRVPEELLASTTFLLKRLGMAAKDRSTGHYDELGVHPYHYAILAVLAEGERETQGAIADALGYDRGQLVGLLDEMEAGGLIERRRDPNDRRRQVVHTTAEGTKMLGKLRKLAQQVEDEFLGMLDDAERAQLHGLLLRLAGDHLPNCEYVTKQR